MDPSIINQSRSFDQVQKEISRSEIYPTIINYEERNRKNLLPELLVSPR